MYYVCIFSEHFVETEVRSGFGYCRGSSSGGAEQELQSKDTFVEGLANVAEKI